MIQLLQDIAQLIDDAGIAQRFDFDTQAGDMFIGEMTDEPDNAIMLVTVPSPTPNDYIPTEQLSFEVWCRDKSALNANNRLRAIHRLLHRKGNFETQSAYVYFLKSTDQVHDMDKDEKGRKLFRLPMQAHYRDLQIP